MAKKYLYRYIFCMNMLKKYLLINLYIKDFKKRCFHG